MTKIKHLLLKICIRLLDSSIEIDYKQIDKRAVEEWAFRSFSDRGWRSYYAYETMKIFKELSLGHDTKRYFLLIGRRIALMNMFNEMRKASENIKTRQEKEAYAKKKKEKAN